MVAHYKNFAVRKFVNDPDRLCKVSALLLANLTCFCPKAGKKEDLSVFTSDPRALQTHMPAKAQARLR
jgi:hypothetical protein